MWYASNSSSYVNSYVNGTTRENSESTVLAIYSIRGRSSCLLPS